MKTRIKFTKKGVLKFIGHLDLLRLFQKAFRRAEIPIAFSQGFNPHQIISIAAPLPIGVTSDGEYMDIELTDTIDKKEAINRLNATLPKGITILNWFDLEDNSKPSMAIVNAADYNVYAEVTSNKSIEELIQKFISQDEIIVSKKSKKQIKNVDIKDGIYKLEYKENTKCFSMLLAAGSTLNIKPELVIKAFCDYLGINIEKMNYSIHRNELFTLANNKFVPIEEI